MGEMEITVNALKGDIKLEYLPCINYAILHHNISVCEVCQIKNQDDKDWNNIQIKIEGEFIKPFSSHVTIIAQGEEIRLNKLNLVPNLEKLIELTEGIETSFTFSVFVEEALVYQSLNPIYLMAYDQWTGINIFPELLSTFVTPNHPLLSKILVNASKFMGQWSNSSSLDEYQTNDPNRVRLQIAAIYEALRSESLVYATPPASFENYGQRIRLVDKVLNEKLGTCMDLTLLFASCLEAAGIHPLLIMMKGHIFVGAWLIDTIYPKTIGYDAAFLIKSCADGINEMVLIESTTLASSQAVDFDSSVIIAENMIKEDDSFLFFIDVTRCRLDNISPLPQRINKDGTWIIENEGIEHENATKQIKKLNRFDIEIKEDDTTITKQMIWERKLLDFSLRNNLINTKLGRKVIPFMSFEIDHLEDKLQAGENYQIISCPKGKILPLNGGMYNSTLLAAQYENLVVSELCNKRLISYLTEGELQTALKFIYRTSRTAIEENGANSLFLVLGILKWFENEKSIQPRYAPILLLPVDIIRKGGSAGYVIRTRDEEMILNITLVELLKQQFKINLSGLDPLPKDDSGVDVKRIFTIIRTHLLNMKRWDIIEESLLGLFSFNRFVMWNDIHSNADNLKNNDIINCLMENRSFIQEKIINIDARELDKEYEPSCFSIPVDVDSSQMEAVVESGEGKSFILYGPPGTGKSQTITNMIANALYKGKRVLFVAEKMAALTVVQNRLAKIGLDPFCLELHSNKTTKSHFLDQLQKAINVLHTVSPNDFKTISDKIFERRKILIQYMESLHLQRNFGYSLYECISNYLSITGDELNIKSLRDNQIQKDVLIEISNNIIFLDTLFNICGHPSSNPLDGLFPLSINPERLQELNDLLVDYKGRIDSLLKQTDIFNKKMSLSVQSTSLDMEWMRNVGLALMNLSCFNEKLLSISLHPEFLGELDETINKGQQRDKFFEELMKEFAPEILSEDYLELKQEWTEINDKWFLVKYFSKKRFIKKLRKYNSSIQEYQIEPFLDLFKSYSSNRTFVQQHSEELQSVFGKLAKLEKEKWNDINKTLQWSKSLSELIIEYTKQHNISYQEVVSNFKDKFDENWLLFYHTSLDYFKNTNTLFIEKDTIESQLEGLATIKFDSNLVSDYPQNIQRWLDNYQNIKNWGLWSLKLQELDDENLNDVVAYIKDKNKSAHEASDAFLKGVYHNLILRIVNSDDSLQRFNGIIFEEIIAKYKELTYEFQVLSQKELYSKLASNIPNITMEVSTSSEMGILKRNISNGGRGTSIRKIIDQIPTLLPKLCPCMLMSPMSVAQFIDINADKFDLVIFDEASQMPTSEAVGAIVRGKSLIVVGDPKQMPPTSFFSSSQVDEDEADFDDMESILEDCITLSVPSRYLSWHYRSKHESLIAFSNQQYYDGKLYTFPSVDDLNSKVRLIPVNGIYDKGHSRSNRIEANAIVKEVIRRLNDDELSKKSIGIISFSQVQQNLIEDILLEELSKYPLLEEKAYQCNEPIFIKNLENVQGDERDVILFSIGYGADKEGKVSMNFGPLNNLGGEKRLNVAVSRARYEMLIFSTIKAEQIDLKRTNAKGVVGLKSFLEFAEKGVLVLSDNLVKDNIKNNMVELLADELKGRGYEVKTMVGRSNFKVDVAVIDPENESNFILGILCDGKNYYETKTARDREIVQPAVMNMLKWNLMRVWSIDWFENKDKVLERIINRLEELKDNKNKKVTDNVIKQAVIPQNSPLVEECCPLINKYEKQYVFANLMEQSADMDYVLMNPDKVYNQLLQIVSVEQPITNVLLYKKIVKLWNLSRCTSRLQVFIDNLLKDDKFYMERGCDNTNTYWSDKGVADDYIFYRIDSQRDILEIPMIEVMNVTIYIIEQQISIPREDLKRIMAKTLGFSRKGANLDMVTNNAIDMLLAQGKLKNKNEMISLL